MWMWFCIDLKLNIIILLPLLLLMIKSLLSHSNRSLFHKTIKNFNLFHFFLTNHNLLKIKPWFLTTLVFINPFVTDYANTIIKRYIRVVCSNWDVLWGVYEGFLILICEDAIDSLEELFLPSGPLLTLDLPSIINLLAWSWPLGCPYLSSINVLRLEQLLTQIFAKNACPIYHHTLCRYLNLLSLWLWEVLLNCWLKIPFRVSIKFLWWQHLIDFFSPIGFDTKFTSQDKILSKSRFHFLHDIFIASLW